MSGQVLLIANDTRAYPISSATDDLAFWLGRERHRREDLFGWSRQDLCEAAARTLGQ
jgi:hypothetical protein